MSVNKFKVQGADGKWRIKTTKTADETRSVYLPPEIISLIQGRGKIYNKFAGEYIKEIIFTFFFTAHIIYQNYSRYHFHERLL